VDERFCTVTTSLADETPMWLEHGRGRGQFNISVTD